MRERDEEHAGGTGARAGKRRDGAKEEIIEGKMREEINRIMEETQKTDVAGSDVKSPPPPTPQHTKTPPGARAGRGHQQ